MHAGEDDSLGKLERAFMSSWIGHMHHIQYISSLSSKAAAGEFFRISVDLVDVITSLSPVDLMTACRRLATTPGVPRYFPPWTQKVESQVIATIANRQVKPLTPDDCLIEMACSLGGAGEDARND